MFAVIDCGTTTTRIYIVDESQQIIASGRKRWACGILPSLEAAMFCGAV